jgi:lysophospholipase L1-like esterase
MFSRLISRGRPATERQGELPFLRRARRLDRAFKAAIVAFTMLALLGMIFGTTAGRRLVWNVRWTVRDWAWMLRLGPGVDRAELEARKHEDRLLGIAETRRNLIKVEERGSPKLREFLHVASLDHDSALIRWGNFDWTLALSSSVFKPDDSGRSYRLRPNTRSVWLINLTIYNVLAMFEIPDTPEARRLGQEVGGWVVPESVQTTNSWGCRGPEPDPSAPVRGIVLGDSNMQGLLVSDDQTPPVRLEARLRDELGKPVSILNTGHLGYSPEQYYYSLVAYFDRFRPQFVVISLCANDFGDMKVERNWNETEYWLDRITQFCRTRNVYFLAVPLPMESRLLGNPTNTIYPGKISAIFHGSGTNYLDPVMEFTEEHLTLRAAAIRDGRPYQYSQLFNQRYRDFHLSAEGCDLWARIVARRLRLIWAQKTPAESGDR